MCENRINYRIDMAISAESGSFWLDGVCGFDNTTIISRLHYKIAMLSTSTMSVSTTSVSTTNFCCFGSLLF